MKLILVLVVLVWNQVHSQPEPAKCCISRQFSATMSDLTSANTDGIAIMEVQIDFDRQEEAIDGYTVHPGSAEKTNRMKSIMNFRTGTVYNIPDDDPSRCTKSTNSVPALPPNCVPDNAIYMGTTYLGPQTSGLMYNAWRYAWPGTQANLTMGLSDSGCVPIIEGLKGELAGSAIDAMFLFTNYEQGLKNPSAFDVPPSCHDDHEDTIGR